MAKQNCSDLCSFRSIGELKREQLMSYRKLSTKEKALSINLDNSIYGAFSEIGAGQEVANNFFRVGGASGTIAISLSAYDKEISDSIYGGHERYVSEPRLTKMLDFGYRVVKKKLISRKKTAKFFNFANTVSTINYQKTNWSHGWIGLRFQLRPESEPNECILHVNLHDKEASQQQEALGVLGVNLLYGCHFYHHDPEYLLNSLLDELSRDRIEINVFRLTGPDFRHVDNRLMALKLVKNGLTEATLFGPDGDVLQPSEELYKKNVLVLRGRFRPLTHVNLDMYDRGLDQFLKCEGVEKDDVRAIFELTLKDLASDGTIDEKDFLDRVDILCSLGHTVMISNYVKYYKVCHYLSQFTKRQKIGLILGIYSLQTIFDPRYYDNLHGGILEAFGLGFGGNVKIFVYPSQIPMSDELYSTRNFEVDEEFKGLLKYFVDNNMIVDIEDANVNNLHIYSDNVLAMIRNGTPGWEEMVPKKVAGAITKNKLFDYKTPKKEVADS